MGKDFSEHRESFGTVKGKSGGSVLDTGVTLNVNGSARGRCPQVILNRLDAKPWEVLEIYDLGVLKGVGDEYLFLMNWWEGA